ncbi:MAG: hypothetical protein ACYDDZ_06680 [Acidimicrobiales bacterium]
MINANGLNEVGCLDIGQPKEKLPSEPDIDAYGLVRKLKLRFPSNAYALLTQVPNVTGAGERRWADAIAFGLWPSRGLDVHGFEVKVSRSDWRVERKEPAKAEEIGRFCDFWWVVVPGKRDAIITRGELPMTWGILRWSGGRWVVDRAAPKRKAEEPGRSFLAAVLRRAQEQMPAEALLATEFQRGKHEQYVNDTTKIEERVNEAKEEAKRLRSCIDTFQMASGIAINSYDPVKAKALGLLVNEIRTRGAPYFESRLRDIGDRAKMIARHVDLELSILQGGSDVCSCIAKNYRHEADDDCKICGGTGIVQKGASTEQPDKSLGMSKEMEAT